MILVIGITSYHGFSFDRIKREFSCGGNDVIEVTRLNDTKLLVNAELIELVEETPDTVITLTTGRKLVVKESRQEIRDLVKFYKRDIMTTNLG